MSRIGVHHLCHDDQYTVTSKSVRATIMTASVLSRMVAPLLVYSLSRFRAFPTRVTSECTQSCQESPRVSHCHGENLGYSLLLYIRIFSPLSDVSLTIVTRVEEGGGISRWFACCILCVCLCCTGTARSQNAALPTRTQCVILCVLTSL